ncbi:MAG TPA: hypothetical protein VF516_10305, partial [Kofleriaceae bacterium]
AISIAAVAAAPFTGGASLAILLPVGVIGAVPSAYRLATRAENGTLRFPRHRRRRASARFCAATAAPRQRQR